MLQQAGRRGGGLDDGAIGREVARKYRDAALCEQRRRRGRDDVAVVARRFLHVVTDRGTVYGKRVRPQVAGHEQFAVHGGLRKARVREKSESE